MKILIKGLWPVMITLFNKKMEVEESSIRSLVNFNILSGLNGLLASCYTSDMFHLSHEERVFTTNVVLDESAL